MNCRQEVRSADGHTMTFCDRPIIERFMEYGKCGSQHWTRIDSHPDPDPSEEELSRAYVVSEGFVSVDAVERARDRIADVRRRDSLAARRREQDIWGPLRERRDLA